MKKQKRKKRLKVGRLFLLIIILFLISFLCAKFVNIPIRSIIIKGNNILTDYEVIKESGLEDYPSYFSVFSYNIKNNLKKNKYIKKVKVRKGLLDITIIIEEKKVLYIDMKTKNKVLEDAEIIDNKVVCAPYLINDIPNEKKEGFIKAMGKIDDDILCLISEIKYDPNEIDDDRYYLYMNDGNSVHLTVNKFDKINRYNSILENIGKQNGTLYLDYGDYFEVK